MASSTGPPAPAGSTSLPGADRERGRLPYLPALDGLRGLAVLAVLAFHAEFAWAAGGHLGVTAFFTLSGFLITALLLIERDSTGKVALGSFWARRARRLVPAMLVCFALVAVVITLMEGPLPSGLIGDAVGSASWLANWRFIFAERTYADVFASPSPFQHFWSLAVEEQFYVVFPLVVAGLAATRTKGGPMRRWPLALVLSVVIVASTIQVGLLHDPGGVTARAYYGTDARVAEILLGALLAIVLVGPTGPKELGRRASLALATLGVVGFGGLLFAFATLGDRETALYEGGFLAAAACTAAVIAGACQPGSAVGRLLSNGVLVRLGWISYGVYLFHWPLFLLLDERSTGLDPVPLFGLRVAATIGLAALSFALVESPIRHGSWPRGLAQLGWANGAVAAVAVVALASGQLVPATAGEPESVDVATSPAPEAKSDGAGGAGVAAPAPTPSGAPSPDAGAQPLSSGGDAQQPQPPPTTAPPQDDGGPQIPQGFAENPDDAPVREVPEGPPGALRIAVVGDSIAENLATGLEIWASERGDVVVYDASIPGCPLSRGGERRFGNGDPFPVSPVCGWWDGRSRDRIDALDRFSPQVVVVHDGVNEMLDRRLDDWDDFRRPGDPRFDRWLVGEYDTAISSWIRSYGSTVVVANAPCAEWDRYGKFRSIEDAEVRIQALNTSVYPQMLEATVADLFERVCPHGTYQNEVEGYSEGRPDGFHFTDAAAAALARNWLGPLILEAREAAPPLLPAG